MNSLSSYREKQLPKVIGCDFQIAKHAYSNQDDVYQITASDKTFYLKVASDLTAEYENLTKLKPYLSVPDVVDFQSIGGKDYLLLSEIEGKNLSELVGQLEATTIVREYAIAVKKFHSIDISKLFAGDYPAGDVVLHGDMSMPNIILSKPGVAGYIDVAKMTVGSMDRDLADAIWSLQRNLGPGYGELFLSEYGDVVMTHKIDKALKFKFHA